MTDKLDNHNNICTLFANYPLTALSELYTTILLILIGSALPEPLAEPLHMNMCIHICIVCI